MRISTNQNTSAGIRPAIYIYIAVCSKRHEILGVGPHEVEIHRGVPWHPLIWRSIAWMTEIYGQDILILWPHFLWI